MRKKLLRLLGTVVLGVASVPAWAQQPPPPPVDADAKAAEKAKLEPPPPTPPSDSVDAAQKLAEKVKAQEAAVKQEAAKAEAAKTEPAAKQDGLLQQGPSPQPVINLGQPKTADSAPPLPFPGAINGNPAQPTPPANSYGIFAMGPNDAGASCNNNKPHDDGPEGYWTLGGAWYFYRPYFSSNPGFVATSTGATSVRTTQSDLNNNMRGAPMGFLSYTSAEGWGIRGRWMEFVTDGTATGSGEFISAANGAGFIGAPGTTSTAYASSNLNLNVIDLEATYVFGNEHASMLISAGCRYASIQESYQLNVLSGATGLQNSFSAYHSFYGFGPTIAAEGRCQIWQTSFGGCDTSCRQQLAFAVYGNARGSLLFGGTSENSSSNFADAGFTGAGSSTGTSIIPVGEFEVGGEAAYTWNRLRVFVQLGAMGQVWGNAGNASQGLYLGTAGSPSSSNGSFGFIGGVARVGVNF